MQEDFFTVSVRSDIDTFYRHRCESNFEFFVREAWVIIEPSRKLMWSWHMSLICRFMQSFQRREFRRGYINVPPRCTKSTIVSIMYPIWVWIQNTDDSQLGNPGHQFICLANKDRLALRDSVNSRSLILSNWFQKHWGNRVIIHKSQDEKGFFKTTRNGHRLSQSVTANITGQGADTILYDDPHDSESIHSILARQAVLDAHDGKISNRVNNIEKSGIMIIMQRQHDDDLCGHIKKKKKQIWVGLVLPMYFDADEKDHIVNPAGLIGFKDPRTKHGEILMKSRFKADDLKSLREDLGEYGVASQLQQRPVMKGGGILKKHWWKLWPADEAMPECLHVFVSWDTAYSAPDLKSNSYSAATYWGVFNDEKYDRKALMLLGEWHGQMDYPDLRKKAKHINQSFQPDCHLVEKKASGLVLIPDLRRAGLQVRSYTPTSDKISRAYAVQSMLQSGQIYRPDRLWAERLVEHVSRFPNGSPPCSDITDTCTQAWLYLRKRWWIEHPDDRLDSVIRGIASEEQSEDSEVNQTRHGYG